MASRASTRTSSSSVASSGGHGSAHSLRRLVTAASARPWAILSRERPGSGALPGVGPPEVLGGVVEVTHQAVDLAELVRRVTRERAAEQPFGVCGLGDGASPVPPRSHLGAVHEA